MSFSTPTKKKRKSDEKVTTPPNISDEGESSSLSSAVQRGHPADISIGTIISSPYKKNIGLHHARSPPRSNSPERNSRKLKLSNRHTVSSDGTATSNGSNGSNVLSLSQQTELLPPTLNNDDMSDGEGLDGLRSDHRGRGSRPTTSTSKTSNGSLSPYRRMSPTHSPMRYSQQLHQRQSQSQSQSLLSQQSQITESQKMELIQLSPNKLKFKMQQLLHSTKQQQSLTESHGKRLYISQLVLTNFKSYAGKQIVGPFHENFTAVVGPNGSGKSNVIDSMLFVFGFRANKLRQGKLSELIHKSETFPNLDFCSVDVHFKYKYSKQSVSAADEATFPAPKDTSFVQDLVVTRKAYKNNTSKYYINGCESTYKEVTDLLRKEGIDLDHKRFLILQGEVESISQMKPKAEKEGEDGVLEYLEDIIGTAQYKEAIENSLQEIEQLNDVCMEKDNRLKIVQTEKDSLESAKDEALEFVQNENILAFNKSKLYQYKIHKSGIKLQNSTDEYSKVKAELEEETSKYESYQKDLDALKQICTSYETQLTKINEECEKLKKTQTLLNSSKISQEEKLKSFQNKKRKAETVLENVQKTIAQLEDTISDLHNEQLNMDEQLSLTSKELKPEKHKLDEMKLKLKEETVDLQRQIETIEHDLEPWVLKIQEIETSITLKQNEIEIMEQAKSNNQQRIQHFETKITESKDKIESNDAKMKKLNKELSAIRKGFSAGEKEVTKANSRLNEMKAVLNAQRQKTLEARSFLATADNQNKVLSALSKLQKAGNIIGFYGRLGDLAVIDEKYSIAISTACPRLNDIVVESVECGQQCIDYLRRNRLGYARFILLDKLRNFNLNPIQTPQNTPRLFDLIKTSNHKFLPAFYSVLRDTLVASNLQHANTVAYSTSKRYRVVTLDGKMIDISGTMSGGGKQVSKDLMRTVKSKDTSSSTGSQTVTLFTQEELSNLERNLTSKEKSFEEASTAVYEMTLELNKLQERIPDIETELSKLKFENETLSTEKELIKSQIEGVRKSLENNPEAEKELQEAQTALEGLKDSLKNTTKQTHTQNEEIEKLKKEILKVGGLDYQLQISKVDSYMQKVSLLTMKLKKSKTSIKKKETELKRAKTATKDAEKDMTKASDELEKIETNLVIISTDLRNADESLESLLNEKDDIKIKYEDAKEELDLKLSKSMDFKSLEVELNNKLSNLSKVVESTRRTIEKSKANLQNLKIHDLTSLSSQLNDEEHIQSGQSEPFELQNEVSNKEQDEMDVDSDLPDGLKQLTISELEAVNIESLQQEIEVLEENLKATNVNTDVLVEYISRLQDYRFRKTELESAVNSRDTVREKCEALKKKRLDEFMEGFSIISLTLKEMYQLITMGGNAELELVDSLDPFSEGVLFSVMPPKKSWRNISNLSGGEKTLSSLALVFALHKYKPTPIYIMDEIDAALDFRNVSIVANYIKDRTKDAQFIVISLRNNMFELSQQLVGIYKNENMTKSTTIKNIDLVHG